MGWAGNKIFCVVSGGQILFDGPKGGGIFPRGGQFFFFGGGEGNSYSQAGGPLPVQNNSSLIFHQQL